MILIQRFAPKLRYNKIHMRKRLTFLISLLSLGLTAQEVAFRDCENPECNQEKLRSIFQETQAAIFKYQGISFNDSISFEFQLKE